MAALFRLRPRVIAVLTLVLIGGLAGCASRDDRAATTPSRDAPSRDAQLLGAWRVTSLRLAGQDPLQANARTTASLEFRRDGLLLVNGAVCGAPTYASDGARLTLEWPAASECTGVRGGDEVSLRIADNLDAFVGRRASIAYTFPAEGRLRLVAGGSEVELTHGTAGEPLPTSGPSSVSASSPEPYSGSAATTPP